METKEKKSVKAAETNKSEVKKENKAEAKKAENKAEKKKADSKDGETEEVNADDLFKHRESIN